MCLIQVAIGSDSTRMEVEEDLLFAARIGYPYPG